MLERLLESKVRRSRSLSGAATSITAHVVIIVIVVQATAQSKPRLTDPTRVVMVPYVPAPPEANPVPQGEERRTETPLPTPRVPGPISIDLKVPPIDFSPPSPAEPGDFVRGGVTFPERGAEAPAPDQSGTFRADQVERQVALLPGAHLPTYPASLRDAGIEGQVVAQFTVNELGIVEADSVRFVRSDNVLFEQSVRGVLKRMRFAAAEIGGKKVRQLVQMPFVFTIGGR